MPGTNVAIHSKLLCFGRIEGGLEAVYKAIREIIGKSATIVVPAYTLKMSADEPFDPLVTKPQSMGSLSDYFFRRKTIVRTVTPLHSHFIDGPLQKTLVDANKNIAMGPQSFFQIMQDEGFKLLLLGCSFQEGATFIHHVEACVGVYYREWITLKKLVKHPDGIPIGFDLKYYARKNDCDLQTNFNVIQDRLTLLGVCKKVSFNFCHSYFMDMQDVKVTVQEALKSNPTILMANEYDRT